MEKQAHEPGAVRAIRVDPGAERAAGPRFLSWFAASALHVAVAVALGWNL